MPFLDDTGPRLEEERSLFGRAFALVRDQLERLVAVNLAWAAPGLLALAAGLLPGLPAWLRAGLLLAAALAWLPATAALFAAAAAAGDGVPVGLDTVGAALRQHWRAAFLKLLPWYGLFGGLALAADAAAAAGFFAGEVAARLAFLCLLPPALYWGPLAVAEPELSPLGLGPRSLRLAWRQPGRTLTAGLLCALAALLGVVSVAGAVLIVPVFIALLQTELYRAALGPGRPARWG